MNDSSPVAKWRQALAIFLTALMVFATMPLEAIAGTVRDVGQLRASIFNHPNPADFGFGDLEVGEAYTPGFSERNRSFSTPDFSETTTPSTGTSENGLLEDEDIVFDSDLRYPLEVVSETDPEVIGLGDPIETGQYHKTYQVSQDSFRTIFTSNPNYFYTSTGTTFTVNTKLAPASTLLANDYLSPLSTPLDVRLPINLSADDNLSVSYTKLGNHLTLTQEGDFTRAAYADNALLYNDVFENIDIEHRVDAEFAHITAIVREQSALDALRDSASDISTESTNTTYALTFEIDSHGLLLEEDEGTLFFICQTSNYPIYALTTPLLICSSEEMSFDTTMSIEHLEDYKYSISFGLDTEWLEDPRRAFPLNLNIELLSQVTTERGGSVVRTVTQRRLYGGFAHGYVGNMRAAYLGVAGARDFGHARYMVYFGQLGNLRDVIPSTSRIDSAHFRVWQFSNHSNGAMVIESYRLFQNWEAQRDTIQWNQAVRMRREPTSQNAGFAQRARIGYQHFDIRTAAENMLTGRETHHGFQLRARNEAHSVSGLATNASNPRSNPGFRETWRPAIIINWTPEPQANLNFPLSGTRGRVTPMVQNSRFGQINTVGTFVYGRARPDTFVNWRVNIRGTSTNPQSGTTLATRPLIYPDSRNFENMLGNPPRLSIFSGRRENWQTGSLFLNPALNTYYY